MARAPAARVPNPYRPGFNQAPGVLAGRDGVLAAAREALDVADLDGRTPRPLVLIGSRGVGKTVLLGEIATVAATEHGWPTVHVEVRPDNRFTAQLVHRLSAVHDLLVEAPPGRRFELRSVTAKLAAFGTGGEVGVERRRPPDPPAELELDRALAATCEAAVARSTGIVVAVDELQLARRPELGDLAATLQQHVPDDWPLVVVVAGLAQIRDPGRSVTYLERGEWHELGLLDHADALVALRGPAAAAGRPLGDEAARLLAEASGGYPYAVQLLGHHAWRRSTGSGRITASHARLAVPDAERELASGLYASRWEDAAPKEQDYLRAVATLIGRDGAASGGPVAAHLGKGTREVSYLRDRLLKAGTLVAVGRELRFPVPGMAAWVAER